LDQQGFIVRHPLKRLAFSVVEGNGFQLAHVSVDAIANPKLDSRVGSICESKVLSVCAPLRGSDLRARRQSDLDFGAVTNSFESQRHSILISVRTVGVWVDAKARQSQHRLRQIADGGITQTSAQQDRVARRTHRGSRRHRRRQYVQNILRRLFVALLGECGCCQSRDQNQHRNSVGGRSGNNTRDAFHLLNSWLND
jgi:hypothetical protein